MSIFCTIYTYIIYPTVSWPAFKADEATKSSFFWIIKDMNFIMRFVTEDVSCPSCKHKNRHRQWHRQWMGFSMVVERPNIVEVIRNPCSTESEYLQEITCSALRKWRMMKMTWFQTCRLQTPLFSRSNRTAKRLLLANVDAAACGMRSSTSTNIYELHLKYRVPDWLFLWHSLDSWASTRVLHRMAWTCEKTSRQTGMFLFSERVRMSRIKKYRWRFDESMKQIHCSTENPLCLRVSCWGNCMAYGEVSQQGHQRVIFCLQRSSA